MGQTKYLSFLGEFEFESVRPLLETLDMLKSDTSIKRVELTLASTGGWFNSAFAVFDYIKAYPKPVDIIATGVCHSSAVLVLQAGAKRLSYPHTDFALHSVTYEVREKTLSDLRTHTLGFKRQEEIYIDMLVHRAKVDRQKMRKLCISEGSFGSEEALNFGLIDAIVAPKNKALGKPRAFTKVV